MANFGYLKSLLGIFKIVSLVLILATCAVGFNAYLNSEYNKTKMDKNPSTTIATTISPGVTSSPVETDRLPILWMERFLLIVNGSCFILSLILLIIFVVKTDAAENPKIRGVDFGYHFLGGILLIISAIFMGYSARKIDSMADEVCSNPDDCQLMKEKLAASGISLLSAIVFLAICVRSFGRKFYETV